MKAFTVKDDDLIAFVDAHRSAPAAGNRVTFDAVGEGKPVLRDGGLHFNLSHAEGRWLLAVSPWPVGVDVERNDRSVDMERVASRIFRPEEIREILTRDGAERRHAVFRAWTGREALVKARGEGMFTLSLPGAMVLDPARELSLEGDDVGAWQLVEVPLSGNWCGALAVDGPASTVRFAPLCFRVRRTSSQERSRTTTCAISA